LLEKPLLEMVQEVDAHSIEVRPASLKECVKEVCIEFQRNYA